MHQPMLESGAHRYGHSKAIPRLAMQALERGEQQTKNRKKQISEGRLHSYLCSFSLTVGFLISFLRSSKVCADVRLQKTR